MNNRYPQTSGMNSPPGIPRDYQYGLTPIPTSNPLYPSGVGFAPNISASSYPSAAFTSGNPSNSSYPAASSSYLLVPNNPYLVFTSPCPASTSQYPASSNIAYPASASSFPTSSNSCYLASCNSLHPAPTSAYPSSCNRQYPASTSSYLATSYATSASTNQSTGASPYSLMGSRTYDSKFLPNIMNNRFPQTQSMNPPPCIPRDYSYGPTPMSTSNPLYPSGVGFAPNMSASPYPSAAFTSGNPSMSSYPAASSSYLLSPNNPYLVFSSPNPTSFNNPYPAPTSAFTTSSNSCYATTCNSTHPAPTSAYPSSTNREYPASTSSYLATFYPAPASTNQPLGASPYLSVGSRAYDSKFEPSVKKMSTPKTKSPPSNLQLVSDEEVAISLERLVDSVVMEVTAHRSALQPQQVQESNDDALSINSLPNEIIEKVFGYLTQNQLGQIARVCRRWNVLTKNPVLWRKVNVKFSPFHGCQTTVAESFINTLSSCVTSIRLDFTVSGSWIEPLDFEVLCPRMQEKCPHLEELILIHSELLNSLSSVIGLCTQFLQDVKNLILHYSDFRCHRSTCECFATSKIKILELLNCFISYYGYFVSPFSKMPHLKQLHLYGTNVDDFWFEDDISFLNQLHVLNLGYTQITAETFQAVQNHGLNLKEFYVCASNLEDHEIPLNNSVFPHLKTICLIGTGVTCEGIFSLIQSCPSLENVYVYEFMAESFAEHPFIVANRCKSGIVKAIDWYHNHNVHYLHT